MYKQKWESDIGLLIGMWLNHKRSQNINLRLRQFGSHKYPTLTILPTLTGIKHTQKKKHHHRSFESVMYIFEHPQLATILFFLAFTATYLYLHMSFFFMLLQHKHIHFYHTLIT